MSSHGSPSRSAVAHAIGLVSLASLLACAPAKLSEDKTLQFDPILMRSPPEVAEVSMQLLATPTNEGNARLRVRFSEKIDRSSLVIQGGRGPTLLRDDGAGADERGGDGVFSALVQFDAAGYEAELQRRAEMARKVREVPVFKNRHLIGYKRQEVPKTMRFLPGQLHQILQFDADPSMVEAARSLMITDVGVVEDPNRTYDPCTNTGTPMGAWTFGTLMTEIANEPATGINPSDFTLHWLQSWSSDLVINSFTVPNRAVGLSSVILNPWPKLPDGRLDLAKAPFRLLAIVNRIDLRGSRTYGSGDAGEARLVFGLLDCNSVTLHDRDFLVIFEYGIRKPSCSEVRDWAIQWLNLGTGTLVLGSSAYNDALQAITDQFTLRDADPSKLPNRSALNQLRSNEFSLANGGFGTDSSWELREFRVCSDGTACSLGHLEETTIAQTPDIWFQIPGPNGLLLRDFMNANEAAILAGRHTVPLQLPLGVAIRAGSVQPGAGVVVNPGGVTNLEARHLFSLATCNGCHTRETGTSFTHISQRAAGSTTQLSGFLTGITVNDPVSSVSRTFHELLDRQVKLSAAANMFCSRRASLAVDDLFPRFVPWSFPH